MHIQCARFGHFSEGKQCSRDIRALKLSLAESLVFVVFRVRVVRPVAVHPCTSRFGARARLRSMR